MKINIQSTRETRIKKLFRATYKDLALNPVMKSMRGNIHSKTLLVAPAPDATEFDNEHLPFSNKAAQFFHELLLTQQGLDTQKHFCIVACSAYGYKPSKMSTLVVRQFVEECAKEGLFRKFISVGSYAYHSIFGDRLVSGPFNPGLTLYPTQLKYKGDCLPLYTLPNIERLVVTAPEGTREAYQEQRAQEKLVQGLLICAKVIKQQFLNL